MNSKALLKYVEEDILNITIDQIRLEDIPAIARIKVDGWKSAYRGIIDDDFLDSLTYNVQIKRFTDGEDSVQGIVAIDEESKQIVGFSTFGKRQDLSEGLPQYDCELHAMYVSPDRKGKGIGKRLLSEVLKQQRENDHKKMLLWCFKKNLPTIEFYKKTGGVLLGEKEIEIEKMRLIEAGFGYEL